MAAKDIWAATHDGESISLSGEIDYTVTPDVRTYLLHEAKKRNGDLSLYLGSLEYIDSSGLAVLIELRRILLKEGRRLVITSVSAPVQKLFALTQVGQLFGI